MDNHIFVSRNGVKVNQIRLESCVGAIMKIKGKIQNLKNIDPVFLFQFSKLEAIIPRIKVEDITEFEIERIERATNNLFNQMKPLFINKREVEVYKGLKH